MNFEINESARNTSGERKYIISLLFCVFCFGEFTRERTKFCIIIRVKSILIDHTVVRESKDRLCFFVPPRVFFFAD